MSPLAKLRYKFGQFSTWLCYISMSFLMFIMFLITAEVILRYLNLPIKGQLEIVEVFAGAILIGAVYAELRDVNVRFASLRARLKEWPHYILELLSLFCIILPTGVISFATFRFALARSGTSLATTTLHWPVWPFIIVVALGFGILSLQSLITLIQRLFNPKSISPQ